MHTISSLRKALGLTSMNQVRNRIEAVKDLLAVDLRRGPNNQILITDHGLEILRQLQELHDSGLTMTEASTLLRAKVDTQDPIAPSVSSSLVANRTKPNESHETVALLKDEIAFLRQRVLHLEEQLQARDSAPGRQNDRPWWETLRGEIDAA